MLQEAIDRPKELLGEVHQRVVGGVRHVELEHRELGVVPGADAFVAVAAPDLVDPLEAAHEQALQVEFRRDAQVEAEVEGVVVGGERPRSGAADHRVQRRGLDLDEALRVEERPETLDDGRARGEGGGRLGVRHRIDVPAPVAQIHVLQAVPLVRQRAERLGQEPERVQLQAELAGLGDHGSAPHLDVIGDVHVVEGRERLAHDVLLGEKLDLPAAVPQAHEGGLAEAAARHQPADQMRLVVAAEGDHLLGVVAELVGRLEQGWREALAERAALDAIADVDVVRKRDCAPGFAPATLSRVAPGSNLLRRSRRARSPPLRASRSWGPAV